MVSLRSRLGVAFLLFMLPAAPLACTADQFVGVDGGSDATTPPDGEAGSPDAPTVDGNLEGGKGDAIGGEGGTCLSEAGSVTVFSCGGSTCASTIQYCNNLKNTCSAIPLQCACDHTCTCLLAAAPTDFCSAGGTIGCTDNNGELSLGCN